MRDNMKACQHTLSDDVIYKEVVVIGNGPSGLVTSYMLAGNVPYLKRNIPEDLPIDEMLRARLSNLQPGQNLLETDLMELAEGLEGRSHNPIPLLMDNLLRPCADLDIDADSLIEWKYDVDKQVEHVVLGRGQPGGSWHSFPPALRTLSPAAWLALPPHRTAHPPHTPHSPHSRLTARALANYCRRYVRVNNLQRFFHCGVTVTSVTRCARGGGGVGGARPAPPQLVPAQHPSASPEVSNSSDPALVVGSGLSAADAVRSLRVRRPVLHAHRNPPAALARLSPTAYPDYWEIYKMMCDGPNEKHHNYTPYPDHVVVDVTPLDPDTNDKYSLKRVTLLDLNNNQTTQVTVSLIVVLIGSRPDLFFLQTNFNINDMEIKKCIKCNNEKENGKIEENQKQCFFKNHWLYFKSVLGQSIQSCKSRYLNYTEINGNTDNKCNNTNCDKIEDGSENFKYDTIIYTDSDKLKCECQTTNPYSSGLGFGIDPSKPVDGRSNPVAIDKSTHELLNAPKGVYALGPLTGDNFIRFIPGGALAIVSHIHKEMKTVAE
ncbi:Oxidative stress-induced growth inhibitor 1 [Papilio machaon]|uniref:Oxidative stress-induced growth inhibitor 1 n=1 Tax=Papilio machaon TaxID=76193 RepID=A0A0N1PGZ3_PAPMA|nr:Oxidative stress-induced growth inhibitor 1 [Papilio machaon]